ncbi:30S ribosomal protein S6 [Candidatus Gracilibacteria bacterium]|nr:30S ribosomal protein S6 [Candidatus Gracilibacteria bacterium]
MGNMAKYELMLILNPSIGEDEKKETLSSVKDAMTSRGAKIEKEDIWGDKHLAYKIKSSTTGYYTLYDLEIDGKVLVEITKIMNLNTNIWRHMFVRKDI